VRGTVVTGMIEDTTMTTEVMGVVTEVVIATTDKIVIVEITDRMRGTIETTIGLKADQRRRRKQVLYLSRIEVMRSHQWIEGSLEKVLELSLQGLMNLLEVEKFLAPHLMMLACHKEVIEGEERVRSLESNMWLS